MAAAITALPRPAGAQLPHFMPLDSRWLDVNYPKLFWTPREGVTGGAYIGFIRQLEFEQIELAAPYAGAISADGQISTSGSRQLVLEGRLPALVKNWRFVLTLEAQRRARENYFGIGNETVYDESLSEIDEHYYQDRATRWLARGEIQRTLAGPLRLLGGFHAERWRLDPLSPGRLAQDAASGIAPAIGRATGDVAFRLGLVYDTRDDEVSANRGVLLQAIHGVADAGLAGDLSYTRTTASAAAYYPLRENLVVAARAVAQGMGGNPAVGSYYLIESTDRFYQGLGGSMSHRALFDNRLLGRDKLLLNVDVRFHAVNLPRTARATIVGFFDTGRVFQGEPFKLTTSALKSGGGVAIFLQLARAGVVGMTLGFGPDGPVMDFATRWTF